MNELLNVNSDTQTVSARELHEKLNIGTEFAKWFSRMCEYGFTTGNDYSEVIVKNGENSKGGRPATDYNISIDMAKQICMIQRTPEGKACRQYLIDLEKAWNTPEQVMARALKLADRTIANLKLTVSEMQPKADYFDALVDKKLNTNVRDTAKELGVKERAFVNFLLDNSYVFRQGKKGELRPYAQYAESGKGLFVLKDKQNENSGWAGQQMFITPKGKETFRLLLESEGILDGK